MRLFFSLLFIFQSSTVFSQNHLKFTCYGYAFKEYASKKDIIYNNVKEDIDVYYNKIVIGSPNKENTYMVIGIPKTQVEVKGQHTSIYEVTDYAGIKRKIEIIYLPEPNKKGFATMIIYFTKGEFIYQLAKKYE